MKNPRVFIEYSNNRQNAYKTFEKDNLRRKCDVLIMFDDMTDGMINNRKSSPTVTELFIWRTKPSISSVFIKHCYFQVLKYDSLNYRHYLLQKIPNEQEFQQITFYFSSDIYFEDFINVYKNVLQNHLAIDTTVASDNLLRVNENLSERI